MHKILVIVPTKGRPESHLEFYESFQATSTIADVVFVLSAGDVDYPRIPGVKYETVDSPNMGGKLNATAIKYAEKYSYIGFMGDDVRIRTSDWDIKLLNEIELIPNCISYGNDLFAPGHLPTAVLLSSNIVTTLGFMAPPTLKHLYIDNFWKELGIRLDSLMYFPEIIWEHMHYSINKSVEDKTYIEGNSSERFKEDSAAYQKFLRNNMDDAVSKLSKGIN